MASCVLLIVNNGDVLRNAYASMRDAGYLVIPLNDAGQAVEHSKRVSFDVVVADMQTLNWVNGEQGEQRAFHAAPPDARYPGGARTHREG